MKVLDNDLRLRLRPLAEAEIPWIAALESDLQQAPWTPGNFKDALAAGYSSTVGVLDGEIVCYGVLMLAAGEAQILNVGVAADFQRRGFGRTLVEAMLNQARRFDAAIVLLEVRVSNRPAINLYESLGFVEIGRRKHYYPAPLSMECPAGREDAIVMQCDLRSQP